METKNEKIEKHIGEQRPINQNQQQSDNGNSSSGNNTSSNTGASNQSTNNPLKPQETQKGLKSSDIKKK